MVQKGKGGKKKANDVNLFAPSNNNPVILPRKCLSRLMPHYAIFFFHGAQKFVYLFIYRFLSLGWKMRHRRCHYNSFIRFYYDLFCKQWFGWGCLSPWEVGKFQVCIRASPNSSKAIPFPTARNGSC